MEQLSDQEIEAGLAALDPPWRREGDALIADVDCEDFAAAVALINRIAEQAERADHHPDILLHSYRRLRITLSTHSAGGLTRLDFALAAAINAVRPG
jgi:4a-hydroxytetrahydrobiopterin dehydratase